MNIPDEVIKKGSITIYDDSDTKIIKEIDEYNKCMLDCRIKMNHMDETKFGYNVLNPLIIFVLCLGGLIKGFSHPVLAIVLLVVYPIIFINFALIKKDFVVSTIATALFLILDWKFLILLIADIVLLWMYSNMNNQIKNQPTYPVFNDIQVRYKRGRRPNDENSNG